MTLPTLMIATAAGAALGSTAGSALMRWTTGGSIRTPSRSRCASCLRTVRPRDLVPVISWFLLGGSCRGCGSAIDRRLPLLEGASAVAVMGVVHVHGVDARAGLLAFGVVAVLLATLTDLEERRIPDPLTGSLAVLAVPGMLLLADGSAERWTVVAWAIGVPLMIEVAVRTLAVGGSRRAVGGGDVKLIVGLLALSLVSDLGPARLLMTALLVGGVHAAGGLLFGRLRLGDRVPFAPAIALAFLTVILFPDAAFPLTRLLEVAR
jgi:leader peptidase (prepilin peptidase)/N-methyltransferase